MFKALPEGNFVSWSGEFRLVFVDDDGSLVLSLHVLVLSAFLKSINAQKVRQFKEGFIGLSRSYVAL